MENKHKNSLKHDFKRVIEFGRKQQKPEKGGHEDSIWAGVKRMSDSKEKEKWKEGVRDGGRKPDQCRSRDTKKRENHQKLLFVNSVDCHMVTQSIWKLGDGWRPVRKQIQLNNMEKSQILGDEVQVGKINIKASSGILQVSGDNSNATSAGSCFLSTRNSSYHINYQTFILFIV